VAYNREVWIESEQRSTWNFWRIGKVW